MSSTHKTFTDGEVLTASDVNNALNGQTADHIPYAVAGGTATAVFAAVSSVVVPITFPAGRFTVPPIVTSSPTGSFATVSRATDITAAGCNLQVWVTNFSNITQTQTVIWQALQMTPTTAAG